MHKSVHKYTGEVKSRNEKSILDYVLINRENRNEIQDVRVKRGAEIYSDHYLVAAIWRINKSKLNEDKNSENLKTYSETMKSYKLQEKEVANKFKECLEIKVDEATRNWTHMNLEELW